MREFVDSKGVQHRSTALQQTQIWATVSAAVAELLRVEPTQLTPETALLDLGAQSLDFVELVSRLERAFQIEMPRELAVPEQQTLQSYVLAVAAGLANAGERPDSSAAAAPPVVNSN